tara:strand:- start:1885 stop:2268 length:384 start_codon:yes stop_codon:yes gene_type:complete
MPRYEDVQDFLMKFRIRQNQIPDVDTDLGILDKRLKHMQEELMEFMYSKNCDDLHGMVDALIDLVYVAYGTAAILGLNSEQWQECFEEVHRANMEKVKDTKDKSHKVGVKKPDGWKAPDFTDILKEK